MDIFIGPLNTITHLLHISHNKDEAQADLETPLNHTKFNALPGQKGASSLLQRRLAERAQPRNQSAPAVINVNIPPELLTAFGAPVDIIPRSIPPAVHIKGDKPSDSLIPPGILNGPSLLLYHVHTITSSSQTTVFYC